MAFLFTNLRERKLVLCYFCHKVMHWCRLLIISRGRGVARGRLGATVLRWKTQLTYRKVPCVTPIREWLKVRSFTKLPTINTI